MKTNHHRYTVQFRIAGKDVDPGNISLCLSLRPTQIRITGERRSEGRVWDESLWSFDGTTEDPSTPTEWDCLEDGLVFLLNMLEQKKPLIDPYIDAKEAIWWCGNFQSSFDGGPTLSSALLNRLGAFGAPIFIDNYFAASDEGNDRPEPKQPELS